MSKLQVPKHFLTLTDGSKLRLKMEVNVILTLTDGSKLQLKMEVNRTNVQDKLKALEKVLRKRNFTQAVITVLNKNAMRSKDLQKHIIEGRRRKSRRRGNRRRARRRKRI